MPWYRRLGQWVLGSSIAGMAANVVMAGGQAIYDIINSKTAVDRAVAIGRLSTIVIGGLAVAGVAAYLGAGTMAAVGVGLLAASGIALAGDVIGELVKEFTNEAKNRTNIRGDETRVAQAVEQGQSYDAYQRQVEGVGPHAAADTRPNARPTHVAATRGPQPRASA